MLKNFLRSNAARPLQLSCRRPLISPLVRPSLGGNYRTIMTGISMSPVVEHALLLKKPVVALESTIVTHGLPYPENLKLALAVEKIIEQNGAVPATIGIIDGVPTVGLSDVQLELLADPSKGHEPIKVSRRDIPYAIAKGKSGGTTVAATMILAHKAGIKVFVTGGLGGVHRGAEISMDISSDLDELARTPVAVVCSGPKSILDVPKTLEYLETKGVHLSTYGPPGTNVPGFFSADSGVKSPFTFADAQEAADIINATDSMDLNSGTVFCVPVPESVSIPKSEIDDIIDRACEDAQVAEVEGKEVTPFILKRVWEATKGQSLETNIEFVKNNAVMATQIAKALANIKTGIDSPPRVKVKGEQERIHTEPLRKEALIASSDAPVVAAVVGSLALDLTCNLTNANIQDKSTFFTSSPGSIVSNIGGVGHNIAKASSYMGLHDKVALVSEICVSDKALLDDLKVNGIVTSTIKVGNLPTARYVAMHDKNGNLIAGCADMATAEHLDETHIQDMLKEYSSSLRAIAFDGNLNTPQIQSVLSQLKDFKTLANRPVVLYEPTSVPKASKLAHVSSLGIFPEQSIDLMTPNEYEIASLFDSFQSQSKFDVDHWFPVIDALGINEVFRNSIESMARKTPDLKDIIKKGTAQQAFHLLPYVPNILIKLGSKGVLSFQLVNNASLINKNQILGYLCCGSKKTDIGVVVQHFPAFAVDVSMIRSVTGAGDTLLGSLLADIALNKWDLQPGDSMVRALQHAQKAASLTIQSDLAVSSTIREIK